ncbi:hypothetical protein ABG768_009844 [Culter alburnus]|uniref:Uncharacterized protein n=1 Tax=Culter alburnus TaxID=194366 RepID=A0AAW1ZFP9_CULAL
MMDGIYEETVRGKVEERGKEELNGGKEGRGERNEGRNALEDRLNEEGKDSARKDWKTEETFNIGIFLFSEDISFPLGLRFQLSFLSLHCFLRYP